jgi:hypothetical protein
MGLGCSVAVGRLRPSPCAVLTQGATSGNPYGISPGEILQKSDASLVEHWLFGSWIGPRRLVHP